MSASGLAFRLWSLLRIPAIATLEPDNDKAGLEYARKASEAIANAGASSVAILHIPDGKPDKWDAYDAIEDGRTTWLAVSI
jgi:DNA primase